MNDLDHSVKQTQTKQNTNGKEDVSTSFKNDSSIKNYRRLRVLLDKMFSWSAHLLRLVRDYVIHFKQLWHLRHSKGER